MKILITLIALSCIGMASAQTESRTEKKYQRYENGELIEDQYYLEENGRVIAGQDFEVPDFDVQMQAMESRMAEMQVRMDSIMSVNQQRMELRMQEMNQRVQKMQQEMELKLQQIQQDAPSAPKESASSETLYGA